MKYSIKIGDKVKITKGKFSGKEDKVLEIDKKNNRIKLEKLKKDKVKTKKGDKELHGTFHISSVAALKVVEKPKKEEAPAEAAEAPKEEAAAPKEETPAKEEKKEEPKAEAKEEKADAKDEKQAS